MAPTPDGKWNLLPSLRGELNELKKLEAVVWSLGRPTCMVNSCQWSTTKEPYIYIPVRPKWISLEFLIDTGAQISVLNKWQAD